MEITMSEYSGKIQRGENPKELGENPKERLGKMKPDLSLIPQSVLVLEAMAMMQGASKYGPYNWRATKVQARTYIAASMRHLAAWLDGEEVAEDSGIHHLAHARASLGVLMDAQVCGMMVDDRPLKGVAGDLIEAYSTRNDPEAEILASLSHGISATMPDTDEPAFIVPESQRGNPKFDPAASLKDGGYIDYSATNPAFYVAGPMRGIPDFNFPAFDAARDLGRRLGFGIISPADMDRVVGVDEGSDLSEVDVRTFVERDVGALMSLVPERGDGIALLPGWERSTGALAEIFVARWLGLRIVSALTFEEFVGGSPADIIAGDLSRVKFDGGR